MGAYVQLSRCLAKDEDDSTKLFFRCPGCGTVHRVIVGTGDDRSWTFNGNMEIPTFGPSIKVEYPQRNGKADFVCHSYVEAGRIRFLDDCSHELKSQTVDLPNWSKS